jgi:aspartate kinase
MLVSKPLHVLKFGGTSVGSIERIKAVAQRVVEVKASGVNPVVVVSAMSGETNKLMGLALEIDNVPNAREIDVLLSAGEQVSMSLLSIAINNLGYEAVSLTATQASILTDANHNDATVRTIQCDRIEALIRENKIVIVAGFQGVNDDGDITTLGRGGSDTTAVMLANALGAHECQIFTDVEGIYTCDPRVVETAQKIDTIDFLSMEEMAKRGAKVLHLPCVQFARAHNISLRVLSSFSNSQGTLVEGEQSLYDISGLALQHDLRLVWVNSSDLDSLGKQCQLLGISVWNVIRETEQSGVIIDQAAYAKLCLVFDEKIRNSEAVSGLTIVGNRAKAATQRSNELLVQHGIQVLGCASGSNYLQFILKPSALVNAANLIHEKQIILREALRQQRKLAIS